MFILTLIVIFKYSQYTCLWDDDITWGNYAKNETIFDCLLFSSPYHGSGYIGFFLCKFLNIELPCLLNIHPYDFAMSYNTLIKAVLIFCIFLTYGAAATIYKKSKIVYLLTIFLIIFYIPFAIYRFRAQVLFVNYNFYRYFFSLLFLLPFINMLGIRITSSDIKNKFADLILMCLFAFVIGTAVELEFYACFLLFCLIFCFNIALKLLCCFAKNKEFFNQFKFKCDAYFFVPLIFLVLAIYLFTNSIGYKMIAEERGIYDVHLSAEFIKYFSKLYFHKIFIEFYYYWILFFCFSIPSFIFAYKRKEVNKCIYPLLIIISILITWYLLILCVNNNGGVTFLDHYNIMFLYGMLIIIPLLMYISYFTKVMYEKNVSRVIYNIVLSILFIISGIALQYEFINNEKINYKYFFTMRIVNRFTKEVYTLEKIMRFYYLQNKTPVLPYWPEFNWIYKNGEHGFNELIKSNITDTYYPKIYKDNISAEKGYYFDENALQKFYDEGGAIYNYELEDIKFSRLKDKDFVLNKKANLENIDKFIDDRYPQKD